MAARTTGAGRKPVTRPSAFWDASALIPLCVRRGITHQVIRLYQSYEVVVWWATPVEVASALARLLRMKHLAPGDWTKANKLAAALADAWSVVQPSHALRAKAMQLVEHYDLRAADALQLSAALEWCEDIPLGRVFLTADQKLRDAALLSGFNAKHL